jgi:hypothetical protein
MVTEVPTPPLTEDSDRDEITVSVAWADPAISVAFTILFPARRGGMVKTAENSPSPSDVTEAGMVVNDAPSNVRTIGLDARNPDPVIKTLVPL